MVGNCQSALQSLCAIHSQKPGAQRSQSKLPALLHAALAEDSAVVQMIRTIQIGLSGNTSIVRRWGGWLALSPPGAASFHLVLGGDEVAWWMNKVTWTGENGNPSAVNTAKRRNRVDRAWHSCVHGVFSWKHWHSNIHLFL